MSSQLIPIKSFLGKYYPELLYSSVQDKYKITGLNKIFEQRFFIQNNKSQMIVDPALPGLTVIITGNEIHISKEMYDHPYINVTNSMESQNQIGNPRSLYNPETFSTVAYLVCNNHTTFEIVGELEEPIYVKYNADYESFYNSIVIFNIAPSVDVEIVEELESFCALNCVTNYIVGEYARVNLTTFYQNHISAISYMYRHVIAQTGCNFTHILFGKGSADVVDETKIHAYSDSRSEFLGCIDSNGKKFNSILYVQPDATTFSINVDYRDIIYNNGIVTFFPVIVGQEHKEMATINVSNITLPNSPKESVNNEIQAYIKDISDRANLERISGAKRFYDNKTKFLLFNK